MPVFPLKLPYLPVDRPVSPFFLHPPPLPPPPPTPPPPPPPSRQPDPSPYPTLCAFQPLVRSPGEYRSLHFPFPLFLSCTPTLHL
ncbi:hypothetical protein AUEXF2481DRAFT_41734 [Aureobasidium subglaciale EXF-2481]|uniref:Uncharacterized protein n=1 Tax=Aureobasidium subglaciale (strain EXF-2481) TaxID=1043005 RepID=A0A074Z380_AURSE|nr:uncharacterized protein AUEXF2481DRAFT_41734 [Aureobasidium subglaciale EXF-2481]KEQ93501.1 hypothetical protein AUEXF2481DRAFT_41734 [Aureobasidium subglaciale EXF-2481]